MSNTFCIIIPSTGLANFMPTRPYSSMPMWFNINGVDYPENGWFDNPGIVLQWWTIGLTNIRAGGETAFKFMEGPFELKVRQLDELYVITSNTNSIYWSGNRAVVILEIARVCKMVQPKFEASSDLIEVSSNLSKCVSLLYGMNEFEV